MLLQEEIKSAQGRRALQAFRAVFFAVLCWWLGNTPLLVLNPVELWPFQKLLALPLMGHLQEYGAISALAWIVLCERASKSILSAVLTLSWLVQADIKE